MRSFAIAEAIYLAAIGLVFAVLYASRSPWQASPVGRNIMALMVGLVALVVALLATLIWNVPTWVFAVILGGLSIALTQCVWLLLRAQRQR